MALEALEKESVFEMKEILDIIHKTIYQFFDVCGDDEKTPMSDKDKLLLEVNKAICNNIKALKQKPSKKIEKCIWIKYDYRTICPRECGGENPYWRIPENMENLKYCPYCGREIEVEE